MFIVLNVSVASRFGCVAILVLYLSALLLIASLTVGISRSLRMSSFLTYQGAFTSVVRILAFVLSLFCLYASLLLSPIVVSRTSRLVL